MRMMMHAAWQWLLLLVTVTPVLSQQVTQRTTPESKVNEVIATKTWFPDEYYAVFDWSTFEMWEPAQQTIDVNNIDYNLLHAAIFYYTNQQRKAHDLPPFKFSEALRNAAVFHCSEMIELSFFGHDNPYRQAFHEPKDRMQYFQYTTYPMGENVAEEYLLKADDVSSYGFRSIGDQYQFYRGDAGRQGETIPQHTYLSFAKNLVRRWMTSSGHRKNILNEKYIYLGCGVKADHRTVNTKVMPMAVSTQNFGG